MRTIISILFGEHKLTAHETVTGRQRSIAAQLSVDPLLSHSNMTSYYKSLISYAEAYHQQIKKALPDPNSEDSVGHSTEPGDCVFWKHHQRKTALEPSQK